MKKLFLAMSVLVLTSVGPIANAQDSHPMLDKILKDRRYGCPQGKSPTRGPSDAPVRIYVFCDFLCPGCKGEQATLKRVMAAYPTQVILVFKNLPLPIHPGAKQKAVLAECMGAQGRFWQAHDLLFAGAPPNKVREGVDEAKLNACIKQGGEGQVEADLALAKQLGLAGTPSFVIDGLRHFGTLNFEQFKYLIDAELARQRASR